jgi:hypothetical protein
LCSTASAESSPPPPRPASDPSRGRAFFSTIWSSTFFCSSTARLMRSILSRVTTSAESFCSISPSLWSLTSLKASKASMNSSKAAVTVSGTALISGAMPLALDTCCVISLFL